MSITYSERIPNNVDLNSLKQEGDAPLQIPQISLHNKCLHTREIDDDQL